VGTLMHIKKHEGSFAIITVKDSFAPRLGNVFVIMSRKGGREPDTSFVQPSVSSSFHMYLLQTVDFLVIVLPNFSVSLDLSRTARTGRIFLDFSEV
jgi:hypothetical protein